MKDFCGINSEKIEEELQELNDDFFWTLEESSFELVTSQKIIKKLEALGLEIVRPRRNEIGDGMWFPKPKDYYEYKEHLSIDFQKDYHFFENDYLPGCMGILRNGEGPVTAIYIGIDDNNYCYTRKSLNQRDISNSILISILIKVIEVIQKNKKHFVGTYKFIFMGSTSRNYGAKLTFENKFVDDVDLFLGFMIVKDIMVGNSIYSLEKFGCSRKYEANFTCVESNNGNEIKALGNVIMNLNILNQKVNSFSEIEVNGFVSNHKKSTIYFEARGLNEEELQIISDQAIRVIISTAIMYDCHYEINKYGQAESIQNKESKQFKSDLKKFRKVQTSNCYFSDIPKIINYLRQRKKQAYCLAINTIHGNNIQDILREGFFDMVDVIYYSKNCTGKIS